MDFLNRVDIKAVGKSVIERLIQTGSFDNLGTRRETLLGNLEQAVEYVQKIKDGKKFGQGSLFMDTGEKEYLDFRFEEFPEISSADKLKTEKELIGFYFSAHPMDEYKVVWENLVKADLGHPETLVLGNHILVGLIKNIKIITTSKGDRMAFAALEDYNGEIELTFFPMAWERCKEKIENDKVAILKGKIEYLQSKDKRSFTVSSVEDTEKMIRAANKKAAEAPRAKTHNREMHIRLAAGAAQNEEMLNSLKNCIEENPGSCPVFIHVPVFALGKESSQNRNSKETIIRAASFIDAEASVSLGSLERCPAVADVWRAG
jgi:DNA polymerase-3 subunit alpha